MTLAPGHVPVRLGSRQRLMLGRKASERAAGPTGELAYAMQIADVDEHAIPVTAAYVMSEMILMCNSDWKGRTRSKELARVGTILGRAVTKYAAHPAFKGRGTIGEHRDVVMPAWGMTVHWRPSSEARERVVLVPSISKWKGSWFTTWEPKPVGWLADAPHLPTPDFDLLESHLFKGSPT